MLQLDIVDLVSSPPEPQGVRVLQILGMNFLHFLIESWVSWGLAISSVSIQAILDGDLLSFVPSLYFSKSLCDIFGDSLQHPSSSDTNIILKLLAFRSVVILWIRERADALSFSLTEGGGLGLGGSGADDGSPGEEESEFLALISHAGHFVVHALVDVVFNSGDGGTAQNSQGKYCCDFHFFLVN